MSAAGDELLGVGAPKLFTLPPSAAFLRELARGLIDATGARENPEALADAQIYLPNQRAVRAFAFALHSELTQSGKGGTLIAPTIKALGHIEEGEDADAFGPEALALPAALSTGYRRGTLAKLIQAWRAAQGEAELPPPSAIAAADELAKLIDQQTLAEDADWSRLEGAIADSDLAEHWKVSSDFLKIIVEAWPAHLKEQRSIDPAARRRLAIEALARRWIDRPPQHPVIIAGSTGSAHETRILMQAAIALPKGLVIFPGLDPDLEDWALVANAPSHPQHTLLRAVTALGAHPSEVRPFPTVEETGPQRARRRLLNEALAPAEATKGWNVRLAHLAQPGSAAELVTAALDGFSLIEAEDEGEEALAAALMLRETLETPGRTAALVTPEAGLARRVASLLTRWGVDIGPSAGEPLHRTRTASLLLLLMRWARDPADPVALMSVLKHACTSLGREPADVLTMVSAIERKMLRGPRLDRTLEHLALRLEKKDMLPEAQLIRDLDGALAPFAESFAASMVEGAWACEATAQLAESIGGGVRIWSGRAGASAAQFLEQLAETSAALGPLPGDLWCGLAETVASGMTVASEKPEHPRIAIWGPLEARLQRRDRMILASLNEGSWPRQAGADAFLNRRLRRLIGLPDPDERIGLSAHDFAELANAPEVILLRAKRVDDKPAVASRWLWRLRTLAASGVGRKQAEAQLASGAAPLAWAQAMRRAGEVTPVKHPEPRPSADKRNLHRFSPSRAVTLIRDPYADFARNILKLERLRRVGEEIDAAHRGTAVHKAIEMFELGDRKDQLGDLIVNELIKAGASPELAEIERPLWLRAARVYFDWSAQRTHVAKWQLEKPGVIMIPTAIGEVELKAKADRIERLADSTLAIIDFKTGTPPTAKQAEAGLEPQLSLEAAIAKRTKFGEVGEAPTSELIYFKFATGRSVADPKNGRPLKFEKKTPEELGEEALAGLIRMIGQYASPTQPYMSKPRVLSVKTYGEYDRLARRSEWTLEEGEE
jgi:ATP-dependent helicase/nuclease subunit B